MTHNNQNNTFSTSFDIIDPETGDVTKSFTFEDLSINFKSSTHVEVARNGQLINVEFYEKNGEFFVFDTEGNCYRNVNNFDLIERVKEEVVDTEQIRAPMPGVVTKVLAKVGDTIEKVRIFLKKTRF
jgi:biotin carboxyl carrier protein